MDLARRIVEAIEAIREPPEKPRAYIGASIVGHPCDALLAFQLRGFPDGEIPPKLKRIFKMGHVIEDIVVADLKKAGMAVWEKDGLTGRQHAYTEWGGHIVCHTDGHIELEPDRLAILEVKSMNEASFKKFQGSGVKLSHPRYFAQLQMMMGLSKIHESLFIAQNKNTQEYHAELVLFDPFEWSFIGERVSRVLSGNGHKISTDETDWRCRDCFKVAACWGGKNPEPACRNCAHAGPRPDGGWHCARHGRPAEELCSDYQLFHPKPKV